MTSIAQTSPKGRPSDSTNDSSVKANNSNLTSDSPTPTTSSSTTPPSTSTSDKPKAFIPEDPELLRVLDTQLTKLLICATKENSESTSCQIKFILDHHKNALPIEEYYLHKLVYWCCSFPQDIGRPLSERLFIEDALITQLNRLKFVNFWDQTHKTLLKLFDGEHFFVTKLVEGWKEDLDPIIAYILIAVYAKKEEEYIEAKKFAVDHSVNIIQSIHSKLGTDFNSHLLLDCILESPYFPFKLKLLSILEFDAFAKHYLEPIKKFYQSVLQMSFKSLASEIGPEHLLSEQLLSRVLELKGRDIDASIATLLSEVLIPGSQGLEAFGKVNSLPEANARGAQLQTCLKDVDHSNSKYVVNWYQVFNHVHSNLFDSSKRGLQPSLFNITFLFLSLDYKPGIIDIFLNYEWWFNKSFFHHLRLMVLDESAYDLSKLNNLTLCYSFDSVAGGGASSSTKNLLKFINIGKLEIQVLNKIQQAPNDGDPELNRNVQEWFNYDCKENTIYLLAAALDLVEKSDFVQRLIDNLFVQILDLRHPSLSAVLQKFKENDVQLLVSNLLKYYMNHPTDGNLVLLVRESLKLDIVEPLLDRVRAGGAYERLLLEFIIEAGDEGWENWKSVLDAQLKDNKPEVYQTLLSVVETRASQDFEVSQQAAAALQAAGEGAIPPPPLPKERGVLRIPTAYYLLEKLKSSGGLIDGERLKNLQLSLLTTYPRLINFGTGHDEAILANGEVSFLFPIAVEQEMKGYYSKMYSKEMEIKDIVEMLVRMKDSDVPHDQDVFACMIHSLLDEYRFFSEYPLLALALTSLLFGALLEKELIQGTTLTVALNFIWESCNQPQDSHLFKFAVQSLYNFKSKLHEYPIYCKHLLECQSLLAHAKMYQIVKDAANGIPCQTQQTTPAPEMQSQQQHQNGNKYQSISLESKTIGFVAQERPNENISDKLLFAINNMTGDNLRLNEIRPHLTEAYYSWFAQYLVGDRAKDEPNNHEMYSNFVTEFGDAIFFDYVLNISLKEVEYIIRNFKDSAVERNQLKTLGAWLGKITLANNKPLKRDQIALKFLLVESYDFNTMHLIVPFVCKILDQAQYSKVFKPPNPWVLGVIKVLIELYECADLKLNLKFEIEVLLNNFKMKVSDVSPSTIIRTHNPNPQALAAMFAVGNDTLGPIEQQLQMQKAWVPPGQQQLQASQQQVPQVGMPQSLVSGGQQQLLPQQQQQLQQQQQQPLQPQHMQQRQMPEPTLNTSFNNLVGNTIFVTNANLRRAFQAALSRAVRECAVPILNRVSEAVVTTTEALVRKDFACEPDANKLRNSYLTMVQQLAHSMIISSGCESLMESIAGNLVQILGNNFSELPAAEMGQAILANVGLCVEILDKIAFENISELIDEHMLKDRKMREQQAKGQPFVDKRVSEYALKLPQPLGLGPDGLTPQQSKIYETFGTNGSVIRSEPFADSETVQQPTESTLTPKMTQLQVQPTVVTQQVQPISQPQPQAQTQPQLQAQQQQPPQQQQITEDFMTADHLFTLITQNCEKAIQLLAGVKETKLSDLGSSHPITAFLTQALSIAQKNALKYPDLLLKAAQYSVNCLFTQTNDNPIASEIYVVVLDKLCEYSSSTAKDVIWWLVHSSDERKFNVPVIFALLKIQLIKPARLDSSLGKLVEKTKSPVIAKFAANLLTQVYTSSELRPIALRSEFAFTLQALRELSFESEEEDEGKGNAAKPEEVKDAIEARNKLFEAIDNNSLYNSTQLYAQLGYVFAEWVKLLSHGSKTLELQDEFVQGLLDTEILTNPEYFEVFFKAAMDIASTSFATEHEIRIRTLSETYLTVDCLAILVARIILKFKDVDEAMDYLKNILAVLVLVLANDHNAGSDQWNERVHFRLFSSLFAAWNSASELDKDATAKFDTKFYTLIAETLNALQPMIFPGFTFAWISLISHRLFLPRLLELPDRQGYQSTLRLLTALCKFQLVYSKEAHNDIISVIFKAINRIFIGILQGYSEFLVECHYQLVTAIPPSYIQLKNLVLSATPFYVHLPNPFTPGLKVERVSGIDDLPFVAYKPVDDLVKIGLKKPVENFLRIPAPALMRTIYNGMKLNTPKEVAGLNGIDIVHYNVKLINALVLHVGISAVADKAPTNTRGFNTKLSQVALLVDLMNHGSNEFRNHLINAIANQLRYPNSHTHWFIGVILHFFSASAIWNSANGLNNQLVVQELITRVLLERRVVSKPHPWGLTIVFTELVKNTDFGFFDLPFVKSCNPALKAIFDSLAHNIKAVPGLATPEGNF